MKNNWQKFLDYLDNYLYNDGWYVQGKRIKDRNYHENDYEGIIQYLTYHCYTKSKSKYIIKQFLKRKNNE